MGEDLDATSITGENEDDEEKEKFQFPACDNAACKYYNEEGFCSFETCKTKIEDPPTAPMVTKTCQICGTQFSVNMNNMLIQICPKCLKSFPKGEGHPHNCVFCGEEIEANPSYFFACCPDCFAKLCAVANGTIASLSLSCNIAHCYECPWE